MSPRQFRRIVLVPLPLPPALSVLTPGAKSGAFAPALLPLAFVRHCLEPASGLVPSRFRDPRGPIAAPLLKVFLVYPSHVSAHDNRSV